MEPIFLVVGGPAAGKSTTSHALAATFPRSFHLPVDDIRHMVVSGLSLPGPDWSDELVRQIALARTAATRVAMDYAAAGMAVVLDDFYDPGGLIEYDELLQRPATYGIVLNPSPAEARRRNAARTPGDAGGYIDEAIPLAYSWLSAAIESLTSRGWFVLDTTHLDVDAAVAAILGHARDRAGVTRASQ
jgi:predicted kinase